MPYAGSQLVELDSYNNSGMQQIVPTTAGASYTLSFMYSPRPHVAASSNGIQVLVNGAVIDTVTGDGAPLSVSNWTRFSYTVVATGATTAVEFRATGVSDSYGGFLDEVSFVAPPGVPIDVPALSEWTRIGLGVIVALSAAVALRRRKLPQRSDHPRW